MKTKHFFLASLCLFSICSIAFGDRQLDRAEILEILGELTSQPRKTWISAGTIQATHEEYRAPKITNATTISNEIIKAVQEYQNNPDKQELAENMQKLKLDAIPFNVRYRLSNELTMNTSVVVKYDGSRFYWEINVNSRRDSVTPNAALAANFMTNQFDLEIRRCHRKLSLPDRIVLSPQQGIAQAKSTVDPRVLRHDRDCVLEQRDGGFASLPRAFGLLQPGKAVALAQRAGEIGEL